MLKRIMNDELKRLKKEIKIIYNEHKYNKNHDGDFFVELDDYNYTMNNLRRIEKSFPKFIFNIEFDNYMVKRLVFKRKNMFII